MLDGLMRRLIDPPLERTARLLAGMGATADGITLVGLVFGVACAGAIAFSLDAVALACLAASRLCDGLDGAVARQTEKTDRGGYLDIVFDFIFYGAVPLGFALRDPATFALPAAVLLFTFYINGASFLAFAALAAKRGMETAARGVKSIYFTAGLAEGTETILAFAVMIVFPAWFPLVAYFFAGLTLMTAISRIVFASVVFREEDEEEEKEKGMR